MVCTTKDNIPQHQPDLSVFPPSYHEAITSSKGEEEEVNSSVTSWSMITGDGANSWPSKKASTIGKILTNGALEVAARVRYYMGFRGKVWSIGAVNGVVAVLLLSFVYAKVRRWRARFKEEKKNRFMCLIQEKDQNIKQLLVQIGQINELLLSSARRRVPVVQIS